MRLQRQHVQRYGEDALVGLSVAVVTLSLGGAFGQLSGRGVLIGMLSAAIIPIITSALGGTRVQCSGPTGPMTAAFVAIMITITHRFSNDGMLMAAGIMNLTLLLTGGFLVIGAIFRVGNWIRVVPNIAISGFMNGIALIIWLSQGKKLLQVGSSFIGGSVLLNCLIALLTAVVAITITRMTKRLPSRYAGMVPGTLIAMAIVTIIASGISVPLEYATAGVSIHGISDIIALFAQNTPTSWPWHLTLPLLPLALQLASVAYIDTVLTSLIIDRMRKEKSARNKELTAQGIAMGAIALFGGIPGAQATERSVLMIREGAYGRFAGISTGLLALVGVLLFQDVISVIPKAVFAGILIKIGYDVFDWTPLRMWCSRHIGRRHGVDHVSTLEMCLILATAFVTAMVDVTIAVFACTVLFYILRRNATVRTHLNDLVPVKETEGMRDEP